MAKRITDNTMTKRKRTNTDLPHTTQNIKYRATQLKTIGELRCSGMVSSSDNHRQEERNKYLK